VDVDQPSIDHDREPKAVTLHDIKGDSSFLSSKSAQHAPFSPFRFKLFNLLLPFLVFDPSVLSGDLYPCFTAFNPDSGSTPFFP